MNTHREPKDPAEIRYLCDLCGRECDTAYYGTAQSEEHVMCRECAEHYWGDVPFGPMEVGQR